MRPTHRSLFTKLSIAGGVLALVAAATTLAPAPATVAVVDLARIFNGLDAFTAFQDAKVKMTEEAQADAAAQRAQIEDLQADLEDFPEGSDRHREALLALQLAAIEFEASLTFRERQMQRFDSESIRNLYESIREGVATFAEARGYDMVIVDDGAEPIPADTADPIAMISSRRVLFAKDAMDVTEAVIEVMNAAAKDSGG